MNRAAILAAILGAITLSGSLFYFGAPPQDLQTTLSQEQIDLLRTTGKYQHIARKVYDGNIEYSVDEFLHPDGVKGYLITVWRTNQNGTVDTRQFSFDRDHETTDWSRVVPLPLYPK